MLVTHGSCPGYGLEPFASLVGDYPGDEVYPIDDFRVEWGPIFHRGRLDGSARLLVLGQDPAAHEAISRRILVGVAGQRVQGLLAKVGITSSYAMVNTYVYSVFGQGGGNRHIKSDAIALYRNRWLDALLVGTRVSAVITFGTLARRAYSAWAATQRGTATAIHRAVLTHPTYPESTGGTGSVVGTRTAQLLAQWNAALPGLVASVTPDPPDPDEPAGHTDIGTPYAASWRPGDLVAIPEADLPAGVPGWWRDVEPWASRVGADAQTKRATITVAVPEGARTWPTL